MFPSPMTGRPYTPGVLRQKVIRKVGRELGLPNVGWHTLRHTYRSLLDANGTPVGVQQRLMRHAEIATTMNRYGDALMDDKRKANTNVVRMVLKKQGESENSDAVGFCGVEQRAAAVAISS